MKQFWGLPAMVLASVIIITLALQLTPHTDLLPNEAAEIIRDAGSWTIHDEEIPLSQSTSAPSTLYEGLSETQTSYVNEVVRLVNEARAQNNLPSLRLDEGLRKAAQVRSAECVRFFSHTRPNGSSYKTAAAEAGVTSNYMGENVASGHITPQEVVQDWMDSEGHRANILNPKFTRLGVGLLENTGNSYRGYAWVQIFSNG